MIKDLLILLLFSGITIGLFILSKLLLEDKYPLLSIILFILFIVSVIISIVLAIRFNIHLIKILSEFW